MSIVDNRFISNNHNPNIIVNLDNVSSIYFNTAKEDVRKNFVIYFTSPAMNKDNEMEVGWEFPNFETALYVYNKIKNGYSTEIK